MTTRLAQRAEIDRLRAVLTTIAEESEEEATRTERTHLERRFGILARNALSMNADEQGHCDFCGRQRVVKPTEHHDEGMPLYACSQCIKDGWSD